MPLIIGQRCGVTMLSTAGSAGVAQALPSAGGSDTSIIACLVNRGLATLTTEKILADEPRSPL
jgi:hypothetical protein